MSKSLAPFTYRFGRLMGNARRGIWLLAAALAVGALRQGREARQVRQGLRPAVYAATTANERILAPCRIAAPPHTATGRMLAALWSAPLTATGLLLALCGGTVPTFDAARHCYVARDVRGPSKWLLRRVNADAHTLGQVVLCQQSQPSPTLLDHESAHVRQAERMGVALPILYGLCAACCGYQRNPFEVAARHFAAAVNMQR